ncbi:MAG: hypothetical protein JXJ17_11820 [Anaerolineae bacterium]|nr:hypothetical protein [Anaerolineae bacterium]
MQYQYPLQMSFKVLAFGPQVFIRNASEQEIFYVHQKAFKLKEDVAVYSDSSKSNQVYRIQADRILDISAEYTLSDTGGAPVGKIKREGMKSVWKASYMIMDGSGQMTHHLKEDNPWIKVLDSVIGSIPLVGIASAFLFHPSYTIYQAGSETPVLRVKKQAAFFEGKFSIESLSEIADPVAENRLLLGVMMVALLERARG